MREKKPNRPQATEAQIREMHDRAQGHAARAAEHEARALEITTDAERRAGRKVNKAEQDAEAYVEKAQQTAAEMVRQAKAQADEDRRKAQAEADEDVRQAYIAAQAVRDERDAEARGQQYWASLAADEVANADLPVVPPTAPMEPVSVTRTDNEVTS